jgi:hypothetical protein
MRLIPLLGWLGCSVLAVASSGCVGEIGDRPDGSGSLAPDPNAQTAVISGARRLTRTEYDDTLRDLLQDTSRSGFAKLPEDVHDPFDNDYRTQQQASAALIEAVETLAEEAAARALADASIRDSLVTCQPTGADDAECLSSFIKSFGRRALRRPLSDAEVAQYLSLQAYAKEGNDFWIGVDLVLRAMLQDLEFLYRVELGTPSPGYPGVFKLTQYEMATRLSYFLLGTTPSDTLLDLAEAGKLGTPEDVRAAAATLLTDERARERVERFHALWLGFHQLPHPEELTQAMRAESAALIDKVVFEDGGDYMQLFRSEQTFLTDYLAGHYGYELPGTDEGAWATYPDDKRRGILSHGSVLSSFGKFADTSPTQRGIFISTRLLCKEIPPPPPNVNADEPPESTSGSNCKIDKYQEHITAGNGCYECHKNMDPIGFGLENFNKAGQWRDHDDGAPECLIEGSGTLEGVGEFTGPAELSELLVESGELQDCVVNQVYRFALGRREGTGDADVLSELREKFASGNYAFDQLLIDVVSTESFGYRKQDEGEK